jgi:adenylate cyclase
MPGETAKHTAGRRDEARLLQTRAKRPGLPNWCKIIAISTLPGHLKLASGRVSDDKGSAGSHTIMNKRKDTTLAIMFADISGSTTLYEKLGDHAARDLVSKCVALMRAQVESHDGIVIKTIGDEVMCTFPGADEAIAAATAMQVGVKEDLPADAPLAIRVGVHYGPAILEAGDVYGDAVNLAARMAGRAKADQIITTRETTDALSPVWHDDVRHVDSMPVKGKSGEIDVFEVIWQPEDVTRFATQFVRKPPPVAVRLKLHYKDKDLELDAQSGTTVIGRGESATLTVDGVKASRHHLRIECLRGKFVLTDQSTNGTTVHSPTGELFLRSGETMILTGSGRIVLGPGTQDLSNVVLFECLAS